MSENADIVIVGAGIAGLYTAYKALKYNNKRRVIILEASNRVGGRIYTNYDVFSRPIEFGAGRFHNGHHLLIRLIHDLGLSNKIISFDNISEPKELKTMLNRIIQTYDDPKNTKHGSCFRDYVLNNQILDQEEWKYFESHYGYSGELINMNLKDAMILVKDMRSHKKYYGLKGGFSQITNKLEEKIRNMGGQIQFNMFVTNIQQNNDGTFLVHTKKPYLKILANKCVLAIPKRELLSIPLLSSIRNNLNMIHTTPLCRIYALYDDAWFKDIKKQAVPNNLRLTIPIDAEKGIIMISYSDEKYARWWKQLYIEHGKKRVIKELTKLTNETFSSEVGSIIPPPKDIAFVYWEDGVACWKSGIEYSNTIQGNDGDASHRSRSTNFTDIERRDDSSKIAKEIARPFGTNTNLYICGENYSKKQQWMESALITCPRI